MGLMILLKKEMSKHKISMFLVFVLLTFICLSIVLSLTLSINSRQYIHQEMDRMGYGDLTIWTHQDSTVLVDDFQQMNDIDKVSIQPLIYAGYSIHQQHSDNEGQLLAYDPIHYPYRFLDDDFQNDLSDVKIQRNEIYISPAMHSMYDLSIGDEIEFEISRQTPNRRFIIKGYFEDPFMGSSMIDMKSFLIHSLDYQELTQQIKNSSTFQLLAKEGSMIHIFQSPQSSLSSTQFHRYINENTNLGQYSEFVYSQDSIYGFMMILQNMLTGFLSAFAIVLWIVSLIVIGYNMTHHIDLQQKDMGILKTIGYTTQHLRLIQMIQYGLSMILAMFVALISAVFLSQYFSHMMVTSTGLLIPSHIPYGLCLLIVMSMMICLIGFIFIKTHRIKTISPIQTIQESQTNQNDTISSPINQKKFLLLLLIIRQLYVGKKRYIGTLVISILLVFFMSVVGRINSWVGTNGEGLMNAFSVAQHDIGVQPMSQVDMNKVEDIIRSYSSIEDVYELAMQNIKMNGVDYTVNVINDPTKFHIIEGTTSNDNEIVITEYIARDQNLSIGDTVTIYGDRGHADYQISGIYQCANEMGASIGMNQQGYQKIGNQSRYIWCIHYLLSDHHQNEQIMRHLQNEFPVELAVHTNSWSGLDGIVETMHLLTYVMYSIVMVFILIVVILTGSKILHFEQKDMAIYKCLGLTSFQMRMMFALRFVIVVLIGGCIGTLLSGLFANQVISYLVSMFGIGEFHVSLDMIMIGLPILVTSVAFMMFAYISSYKIKIFALVSFIHE